VPEAGWRKLSLFKQAQKYSYPYNLFLSVLLLLPLAPFLMHTHCTPTAAGGFIPHARGADSHPCIRPPAPLPLLLLLLLPLAPFLAHPLPSRSC
jgi:hypothetical protein